MTGARIDPPAPPDAPEDPAVARPEAAAPSPAPAPDEAGSKAPEDAPEAPQAPQAPQSREGEAPEGAPASGASAPGGARPVLAGVIAGLIAGALAGGAVGGFAPGPAAPPPSPDPAEVAALRADLAALGVRLGTLEPRVPADPAPALGALEGRLAALEARGWADPAAIAAEFEALRAAQAAAVGTTAAEAALGAARDRAIAEIEAAREALRAVDAARAAAAEAELRASMRRGLIAGIGAALETGEPFGPLLDDLAQAGTPAPAALGAVAAGAPTGAALVEGWAPAARAALAASRRIDPEAPLGQRIADFLRIQTGARPLRPQAGQGADAILSRAEAALRAGALGDAAAEIATLPPEARAALGGWMAGFEARRAALEALAALRAQEGVGP
ncbi:MAG: hypothetical protein ACO38S_12540 [Gemmobacter sp.]